MAADSPHRPSLRPDGYLARFHLEIAFDTNNARDRYDHVGTIARCAHCHQELPLHRNVQNLIRHARGHENELTTA